MRANASFYPIDPRCLVVFDEPISKPTFDAMATLTTAADATVASGGMKVARGARTFRIALTSPQPLAAGDDVLELSDGKSRMLSAFRVIQ